MCFRENVLGLQCFFFFPQRVVLQLVLQITCREVVKGECWHRISDQKAHVKVQDIFLDIYL